MPAPRWVLIPLAIWSALSAYLALEKLTGGNPAFYRSDPRPFVAPPPVETRIPEAPEPPVLEPKAPPGATPLDDWTRLPPPPGR